MPGTEVRIAVIGSAGRRDDAARMTRPLYEAMYAELGEALRRWSASACVSGGAAFADHLAVRAFLDGLVRDLVLFLPARFAGGRYVEGAAANDAGRTANRYHRDFSAACGVVSLAELALAIDRGARVEVHQGFKRRNLEVAAGCTHMLAFTFGAVREPADLKEGDGGFRSAALAGLKDGGTAHTWGECWRAERKRHVSLSWLERRIGAADDFAPEGLDPFRR